MVYSNFDTLFLTETWMLGDVSPAFKAATPATYQYFHEARPVTGSGSQGGGCGSIISSHILNVKFSCRKCSTFESLETQFNCSNDKIVAHLVCRPAGHIINDFLWVLRVH